MKYNHILGEHKTAFLQILDDRNYTDMSHYQQVPNNKLYFIDNYLKKTNGGIINKILIKKRDP